MRNFILVGTQRTGSSALAEQIGFHPDIACGWEWTQRVQWTQKIHVAEESLQGNFSLLPGKEQAYMKRIFTPQKRWLGYRRLFRSSDKWVFHPRYAPALWVDRLEDHLKWFRSRPDMHIIHLRRDDNIAWLKSKYFSKKSGVYVAKAYPDGIEIYIPINEAIARIESKMWVDERLSTLSSSNPYLEVWYEDFSLDKISLTHTAYQFLGCDSELAHLTMEAGRKRQSSEELSKGIKNYAELVLELGNRQLLSAGRAINSAA